MVGPGNGFTARGVGRYPTRAWMDRSWDGHGHVLSSGVSSTRALISFAQPNEAAPLYLGSSGVVTFQATNTNRSTCFAVCACSPPSARRAPAVRPPCSLPGMPTPFRLPQSLGRWRPCGIPPRTGDAPAPPPLLPHPVFPGFSDGGSLRPIMPFSSARVAGITHRKQLVKKHVGDTSLWSAREAPCMNTNKDATKQQTLWCLKR